MSDLRSQSSRPFSSLPLPKNEDEAIKGLGSGVSREESVQSILGCVMKKGSLAMWLQVLRWLWRAYEDISIP